MKKHLTWLKVLCVLFCLLPGIRANASFAEMKTAADGAIFVPVTLKGGSGKASVESPAEVRAEEGGYTALIRWSSSNYDYMVVDGKICEPISTDGGALFEIPVPGIPCTVEVQADTVAMSQPHLIDYTLIFGGDLSEGSEEPGEARETEKSEEPGEAEESEESDGMTASKNAAGEPLTGMSMTGSMELDYAEQFSVDYYDIYSLVTIPGDGSRFLLVPEGKDEPLGLPPDVRVLSVPVKNIYLVASAAADLFAACGGISSVRLIGQKPEDSAVPAVREAAEAGSILYAGKYSAPDYERILSEECRLAVENTMIFHTPEVREQLESLGIPVLVDHASYESTPQGRMEWIKLYGLLTGREPEAEEAFQKQLDKFKALEGQEFTGKTVAYFHISTGGMAVVRRSEDYIPALIRLAGGEYAFSDTGAEKGTHSATFAIQLEEFYAAVKDADYLIYSSELGGTLGSIDDLLGKCKLLEKCRAVQDGHVYCTTGDLYQSTMEMGDFVTDLHRMLTEEDPDMTFLYKVE